LASTIKIFCLTAVLLFLCSCKKEIEVTPEIPVTDVKPGTIGNTLTTAKNTKEFERLINNLVALRQEIMAQLPGLNPQECNALFEKHLTDINSLIIKAENEEKYLLNNYYNIVKYNETGLVYMPDWVKNETHLLAKAKLEIWDIGEGIVEIRAIPDYYKDLFARYVTPDYRAYIILTAEENKMLFDNDGAIAISWEDVGKRVFNWENYITKYPESKLYQNALDNYLYYQNAFLVGADNTPVMDYENNTEYPEVRNSFNSFIKKHPNSPTSPLIKMVLGFKGNQTELETLILQKQQLPGKTD